MANNSEAILEKLAMEVVMTEPGHSHNHSNLLALLKELDEHLTSDSSDESARKLVELLGGELQNDKTPVTPAQVEKLNQLISQLRQTPAESSSPSINHVPLVFDVAGDREILVEFVNEAHEHLAQIERAALALEENPSDEQGLHQVFAACHTLKGGAGLLNLIPINQLAHELESLLDLVREGKTTLTPDKVSVILSGRDCLKTFVCEIEAQLSGKKKSQPFILPTQALIAKIRAAQRKTPKAVSTSISPAPTSAPPELKESEASKPIQELQEERSAMLRVDTHKLDSLMDLVGEMLVAHSMVVRDVESFIKSDERSKNNLSQLGRITNDLHRITMSLRMVPIRPTFHKMSRLVRDVASNLGKKVRILFVGEDTELDRTIVELIADPIMHMIRNALDHGIEKPLVRTALGKSAMGTIYLRAYHRSGKVIIEIEDDGGGMDPANIRAKALEKNLISADDDLSEGEILDLIFAPGFSTASEISDISGRGVGMDVVHNNVEKLRGLIDVRSELGNGSVFTITLPLTLAIIDGLIVGIGTERYIIPTISIRESFRPKAEMILTLQGQGEMVNIRGQLSPLLRLGDYYGIEPNSHNPAECIIVRVESDQEERCLLVDSLIGKQEVVIKSLQESVQAKSSLAGAAILGDGQVGLILDIGALVKLK